MNNTIINSNTLFDSQLDSSVEEKNILQLYQTYGSPFYIFHEDEFKTNFIHLCESFRKIYPNYIPAYSYKTNYMPYVCNLVKEMGGYAEVVSDMEYFLAKKLGHSNSTIIYNGPCKGPKLEEHILSGGIVNIDNVTEAERILDIAHKNTNHLIKVGLRLNFDVGTDYISRFGIETDSVSFHYILKTFSVCDNIEIVGVHCHISRARSLSAWKLRIDTLLDTVQKYIKKTPDYIDVGSGMFGSMHTSMAKQFDIHIPTYNEYAEVVAGAMNSAFKHCKKKPILFSEPGTTLISKYMSMVSKVNNIKTIKNKIFATIDASFYNAGETCKFKKLPYKIIHSTTLNPGNKTYKNANVMGYTCLEQDCIYPNMEQPIAVNDLIVFGNVGGYSLVSKPPFIHPNFKVLLVSSDRGITEIKRDETNEEIFKTFLL